jgi:hypothetical protein
MNPTIKIHNAETDEVIEREMTAEELKQWNKDKSNAEAELADAKKVEAEKAALLVKLGISSDEAKLLLS